MTNSHNHSIIKAKTIASSIPIKDQATDSKSYKIREKKNGTNEKSTIQRNLTNELDERKYFYPSEANPHEISGLRIRFTLYYLQ